MMYEAIIRGCGFRPKFSGTSSARHVKGTGPAAPHLGRTGLNLLATPLLWAYSIVSKHAAKSLTKKRGSNFEQHQAVLSEVEEKYDEVRKKHGNKITLEQLRMWAEMIRLGKH